MSLIKQKGIEIILAGVLLYAIGAIGLLLSANMMYGIGDFNREFPLFVASINHLNELLGIPALCLLFIWTVLHFVTDKILLSALLSFLVYVGGYIYLRMNGLVLFIAPGNCRVELVGGGDRAFGDLISLFYQCVMGLEGYFCERFLVTFLS